MSRNVRLSDIDAVLRAHTPSITPEIEDELAEKAAIVGMAWSEGGEPIDTADLALRVCSCGVRIDGYYEFVDHLSAVVREAWTDALIRTVMPLIK